MTFKLKMLRSLRRPFRLLAFALLILMVVGCQAQEASEGREATMGLDVVGYNHTDRNIGDFSVNGGGGTFLMRHKGGGKFTCCISIPRTYRPGMTVTVRWWGKEIETQEKVVEVPPYTPEDGGDFAVHFLRNGEVKVFVTMFAPQHPDYPLKGEDARM